MAASLKKSALVEGGVFVPRLEQGAGLCYDCFKGASVNHTKNKLFCAVGYVHTTVVVLVY